VNTKEIDCCYNCKHGCEGYGGDFWCEVDGEKPEMPELQDHAGWDLYNEWEAEYNVRPGRICDRFERG